MYSNFLFKDLSIALGQTDRIPIILAVWAPVIALSFFTFIGVLQINENKYLLSVLFFLINFSVFAENISIELKKITLDKKRELSIFQDEVLITTQNKDILIKK